MAKDDLFDDFDDLKDDFDMGPLDIGSRGPSEGGMETDSDTDDKGKPKQRPASPIIKTIYKKSAKAAPAAAAGIKSGVTKAFGATDSSKFIESFTKQMTDTMSSGFADLKEDYKEVRSLLSRTVPSMASLAPKPLRGGIRGASKVLFGKSHEYERPQAYESLSPEERAARDKEEAEINRRAERESKINSIGNMFKGSGSTLGSPGNGVGSIAMSKAILSSADQQAKSSKIANHLMGNIGVAIGAQTSFFKGTYTAYLKKDLEIKYRTMYLTEDVLNLIKQHAETTQTLLDKIRHNTGLPESAKQVQDETIMGAIKSHVGNVTTEWFNSYKDKFIENFKENTIGRAKDVLGQVSMGLGLMEGGSVSDIVKMMLTDGEDLPTALLKKGASFAGRKTTERILRGLPKDVADKITAHVSNIDTDLPLLIESIASGKRPDFLKDIPDSVWGALQGAASLGAVGMDKSSGSVVNANLLRDPTAAGTITNRFVTTVEDVIPSYLRMQTRFLEAMATGRSVSDVDERAFDFKQGKMTTAKSIIKQVHKSAYNAERAGSILSSTIGSLRSTAAYKSLQGDSKTTVDNSIIDIAQITQNLAAAKDYSYRTITPEMIPWFKDVAANGKLSDYADDPEAREWYKTVFKDNVEDPKSVSKALVDIITTDPRVGSSFTTAIKDTVSKHFKSGILDAHRGAVDDLRKYGYGTLAEADAFFELDKRGNRKVNNQGDGLLLSEDNFARSFKMGKGFVNKEALLRGDYDAYDPTSGTNINAFARTASNLILKGDGFLDGLMDKAGGIAAKHISKNAAGKEFLDSIDKRLAGIGKGLGDAINNAGRIAKSTNYLHHSEIPEVIKFLHAAKCSAAIPLLFEKDDNGTIVRIRNVSSQQAISDVVRDRSVLTALRRMETICWEHHGDPIYDKIERAIPIGYRRLLDLYDKLDECLESEDPELALAEALKATGDTLVEDTILKGRKLAEKYLDDSLHKYGIVGERPPKQSTEKKKKPKDAPAEPPKPEGPSREDTLKAASPSYSSSTYVFGGNVSGGTTHVSGGLTADQLIRALTDSSVTTSRTTSVMEGVYSAFKRIRDEGGLLSSSAKTTPEPIEVKFPTGELKEVLVSSDVTRVYGDIITEAISRGLDQAKDKGLFTFNPTQATSPLGGTVVSSNPALDPAKERPSSMDRDPVNHLIYQTTVMESQLNKLKDVDLHLNSYLQTLADMGTNLVEATGGFFSGIFGRFRRKRKDKGEPIGNAERKKRNPILNALMGSVKGIKSFYWDLPTAVTKKVVGGLWRVGKSAVGLSDSMVRLRPGANQDLEDTTILITPEQFRAGVFFDKEGKERVTSVNDINRPVFDGNGELLVTKEDLKIGLVDGRGHPLRSMSAVLGRAMNKVVSKTANAVWKTAKFSAKTTYAVAKRTVGLLADAALAPITAATAALIRWRDIYVVTDMSAPLVTARALSHDLLCYADGEPIKDAYTIDRAVYWRDIPDNGARRGQVAISEEDIDAGLVDFHGKKLSSFSRSIGSLARRGLGLAGKAAWGIAKSTFNIGVWSAKTAGNAVVSVFKKKNPYIDVYVKDKYGKITPGEPRLRGLLIKEQVWGGKKSYFYTDGTIVKSAYGITQRVVDENNSILIDEDELERVCDINGKSLTSFAGASIAGKLVRLSTMAASTAIKGAWTVAKGLGKATLGVGDFLTRKLWVLGKEAVALAYGSMRDILSIAFNGGKLVTREDLDEVVGNRLVSIYNLLNDRLPGKRVAGDIDGDGIRDGSYEDQKRKREAKRQARADKAAQQNAAKGGWGITDIFKKGMSLFGGKDSDEGDDDGGNSYDIDIDRDDKEDKKKRGKKNSGRKTSSRAKPRGKFGKIVDGFKRIVTRGGSSVAKSGLQEAGKRTVTNTAKKVAQQAAKETIKRAAVQGATRAVTRAATRAGVQLATKSGWGIAVAATGAAIYGAYAWLSDSDTVENLRNFRGTLYGIDDPDKYEDAIEDMEEIILEAFQNKRKWPLDDDTLADIAASFDLINKGILGFGSDSFDLIKKRLAYLSTWLSERVVPIYQAYTVAVNSLGEQPKEDPDPAKTIYREPDPDDAFENADIAKDFIGQFGESTKDIVGRSKALVPTVKGFESWWKAEYNSDPTLEARIKSGKYNNTATADTLINGGSSLLRTAEEDKLKLEQHAVIEKMKARNAEIEAKNKEANRSTWRSRLDTMFEATVATLPVQLPDFVTDKMKDLAFSTYDSQTSSAASNNGTYSSVAGAGMAAMGGVASGPAVSSFVDNYKITNASAANIPDGGKGDLGVYVEKFESGSRGTEAIGRDSTGGTSFGKYQIAYSTGTFKKFLEYAKEVGGQFGSELASAFGRLSPQEIDGGKNGPGAKLWRKFAQAGDALSKLEKGFIYKTHYQKGLDAIGDPKIVQAITADRGLREAFWSTSIQHGPGDRNVGAAGIFRKTYVENDPEAWLKAIYTKRGNQFPSSTAAVQASVRRRFAQELPIVMGLSKSAPQENMDPNTQGGQAEGPDGEGGTMSAGAPAATGVPYSGGSGSPMTDSTDSTLQAGKTPSAEQVNKYTPKSKQDALLLLQSLGVKAYNTTGGGGYKGVSQVNDELLTRFAGAAAAFRDATGKTISITSAYRSPADQAGLQGTVGAAKVGKSPHQRGMALDIGDANGGGVKGRGYGVGTIADLFEPYAKMFGLHRPYNPMNKTGRGLSNEEQHFEMSNSAPDTRSPESQGLEGGVPLMGGGGSSTTAVSASQSVTADTSAGNLTSGGTYPSGGSGTSSPAMPSASSSSADTSTGGMDASSSVAASSTGGSSGSTDSSSIGSSLGPTTTDIKVTTASNPMSSLPASPLTSEGTDTVAEMKTQSQYLNEVVSKLGELLTLAKAITGPVKSDGTPTDGTVTSPAEGQLATALEAYLGENSPIITALSGLAGGNNVTTNTSSKSSQAIPTKQAVVRSPINVSKTQYA